MVKLVIIEHDGTRVILQLDPDAADTTSGKMVEVAAAARRWKATTPTT